ncbi:unnamed protein product [Adineta steineri]|uniref:Uncharacterized protein n=1 Tax=Adineta steineri TaxID=433720 RepID=A0A814DU51_9BILA|nr:unnamed protein product [Adineta steineri]CAF0955158.1 unnamed protein product [Adineta steineri]CAF0960187.1 unnamed protein product [Adineta steineri]
MNTHQEFDSNDDRFGFIIMDTNQTLFGILHGNIRDILMEFTVDLPKKRRYGGASSIRFARIRKEKKLNYVRKVSQMATQCFIRNEKINVNGIILAIVAQFTTEFNADDVFDSRIQEKLIQRVVISYGGHLGFNQAIELANETLVNVKFVQEKKILSQFFNEIFKDSNEFCFGLNDTMNKLESGQIDTLIIWKNCDLIRYVLRHIQTKQIKIIYLQIDKEKEIDNELEQLEKISLIHWLEKNYEKMNIKLEIVTDKSQEGSQFVHGFTGIGGILRHKLDHQSLNIIEKNCENIDSNIDNDDYSAFFLD